MYFITSYTFVHCTDQQHPTQSCCRNAPLFILSHWFSWPLCLAASGGKKHAHVLCELICWERQRSCAAGESSRTACRIPILNMHSWVLFCMLHISKRFIWFHWGFIYNFFYISQTVAVSIALQQQEFQSGLHGFRFANKSDSSQPNATRNVSYRGKRCITIIMYEEKLQEALNQ